MRPFRRKVFGRASGTRQEQSIRPKISQIDFELTELFEVWPGPPKPAVGFRVAADGEDLRRRRVPQEPRVLGVVAHPGQPRVAPRVGEAAPPEGVAGHAAARAAAARRRRLREGLGADAPRLVAPGPRAQGRRGDDAAPRRRRGRRRRRRRGRGARGLVFAPREDEEAGREARPVRDDGGRRQRHVEREGAAAEEGRVRRRAPRRRARVRRARDVLGGVDGDDERRRVLLGGLAPRRRRLA